MELRATLKEKKRIVIKVGTSTVTYAKTGNINLEKLEKFVRVLINLRNRGKEVIVVSSGAVGIGKNVLGISEKPAGSVKQACAAVGQGRLMMIYEKFFAEYSQLTAQVLLTKKSVYSKTCRIHAKETFEELLAMNVVPIVNANDAISVDEDSYGNFGDNDTMSADVAGADMVIANGDNIYAINDIMAGKKVGTLFLAKNHRYDGENELGPERDAYRMERRLKRNMQYRMAVEK